MADSADLLFRIKAKDEASSVVTGATKNISGEVKALDSVVGKLAQSFGFSNSQISSFSKALPVVGAAVGAVSAAVVGAGTAIFSMTKRASDAGSEIFEFAQRTNLSAEFLSTLKVQAEQSGSSLSSAAASATKFANGLVDAARGNKDLIADLKRFGIDATQAYRNPEASLRQFIEQFNKLPASAANNEAAMRLFKDRTGAVIPVLRSFGTDIDGLMDRLGKMGLLWDKEGTEKADEFGDSLTELGQAASGMSNVFAREVMPAITEAMRDISKSVVKNRAEFKEWGRDVGDVIRGVRTILDGNGASILSWLKAIAIGFNPVLAGVQIIRGVGAQAGDAEALKNFGPFGGRGVETPVTAGAPAPSPLAPDDVTNEGQQKRADAVLAKARAEGVKAAATAAETAYKETVDAAEAAYRQTGNLVELIGALKQAEADRWAARKAQFQQERDAIAATVEDEALGRAQIHTKHEEEKAARSAHIARMVDLDREGDEKRLTEVKTTTARELQLHDLRAAEFIRRQKELAEGGQITFAKAQKEISVKAAEGFRLRHELLLKEQEAAKGNAEAYEEVTHRLAILTEEAQQFSRASRVEATAATIEDLERLINRVDAALEKMRAVPVAPAGFEGVNIPQGAGPMVAPDGTTPPELPFSGDIFQEWGAKVGEVFGVVKEQAKGVGDIISESFGMMANAAGSAIKAFVLFGSAGGSFRKFAAEVIASVASMAIVQAVWELAQGLAMLALSWFTGNPKYAKSAGGHFAAAAMYGTIGGVAAVAGRALAGNSFAEGGGGGAGGIGDAGNEREDYRTRYLREQGEKDKNTRREDRRGGDLVLNVDGRELARANLNAIRDGGDLRDGYRNAFAT